MRIALQFSGQLRNFQQCAYFFKTQLLNRVPIDIFVSTWKVNSTAQLFSDEGTIRDFLNLYNIAAHRIEELNQDYFLHLIKSCKSGVNTRVKYDYMVYGFYQRWQCNLLRKEYEKKHNIKYDRVIITRPDLILGEPLKFDVISSYPDHLLIPAGSDWEYGINDLLAIGNNEHINVYCDLFNQLPNYIKRGVLIHPEHLLKYHLDEYNVPVKRFSLITHLRARRMT